MENEVKKKIIVFTTYFYPHLGGYEKNVEGLFQRITEKSFFDVDIVCFNTESVKNFEKRGGLNIHRINCWNIIGGTYAIPKPISLVKVYNKLKKNKYNAVSTQTRFFISSFLGHVFSKVNGAKLIHTERGTTFVKHKNIFIFLCSIIFDQTIGRLVISSADIVTGVSQKACDFTKKLGAKNPIKIYNGIDYDFWKKCNNDSEILNKNKINIVFVGRVIEAKGVQDLFKAVKNCNFKNEISITIVGDGNYINELKKNVEKNLVGIDVVFVGAKKANEIIKILSQTDIFVNPSHTEGLPTSVIEAGACECAVVASNVGGTSEIIDHGKNGFIFESKNITQLKKYLEDLINDEERRLIFGKKLRKKVIKKFGWDKIVNQYIQLIEK